jgi:hypothetical protein
MHEARASAAGAPGFGASATSAMLRRPVESRVDPTARDATTGADTGQRDAPAVARIADSGRSDQALPLATVTVIGVDIVSTRAV